MKCCITCDASYFSSIINCPSCGFEPIFVENFPAYAPSLAYAGGGFKASHFAELADLEESNFWFRARNQLIIWALEKYCHSFQSFLLPAMLLSRMKNRKLNKNFNMKDELRLSKILNTVFYQMMLGEINLIKRGVNFSFGGSRLIVAKKAGVGIK